MKAMCSSRKKDSWEKVRANDCSTPLRDPSRTEQVRKTYTSQRNLLYPLGGHFLPYHTVTEPSLISFAWLLTESNCICPLLHRRFDTCLLPLDDCREEELRNQEKVGRRGSKFRRKHREFETMPEWTPQALSRKQAERNG